MKWRHHHNPRWFVWVGDWSDNLTLPSQVTCLGWRQIEWRPNQCQQMEWQPNLAIPSDLFRREIDGDLSVPTQDISIVTKWLAWAGDRIWWTTWSSRNRWARVSKMGWRPKFVELLALLGTPSRQCYNVMFIALDQHFFLGLTRLFFSIIKNKYDHTFLDFYFSAETSDFSRLCAVIYFFIKK